MSPNDIYDVSTKLENRFPDALVLYWDDGYWTVEYHDTYTTYIDKYKLVGGKLVCYEMECM